MDLRGDRSFRYVERGSTVIPEGAWYNISITPVEGGRQRYTVCLDGDRPYCPIPG